jgi:predicted HTH transcriptional regulator
VPRIAEVACSIANLSPGADGYIYIGVADQQADADRIAQLDNVSAIEVGHTHVVGIDREAKIAKQSVDQYVRNMVAEIRQTNLSEPLKSALLGAVDTILYRCMSVVRLTVPGQKEMSWVGERSFVREGSETKEATPKQIAAITDRFSKARES